MIQNHKARRGIDALERLGIEPTSDISHHIMTTAEAATHSRLSQPTMERFRISGEGPVFIKLGGAVRYFRRDIDAWLESRRIRSTSDGGAK